ncbi:hypothetical protein IGI04_026987 [Brassica rapa subsp. trilocularis]|uniref:ER lumen protein-retaining receptor n=1 Tax=Brassica rapa subsp. trilocularis TaxID=1813537 RepID=A0ABQ7L039_BRACM|nr:hypothetical protein IGI04_026987 [Brassica rapa subsp. trilocularis]
MMKELKSRIQYAMSWIRRQPPKVKAFLAVVSAMTVLVFLRVIVHDKEYLFLASEAVHATGISVLIYKLTKERTCAGLSLKTQELTALYLGVRLYCSFVMEFGLHTLLDSAAFFTTLWVIYMIRLKLRATYMEDKDNFVIYYVIVEPFTAHYVFALGIARFLNCAHWILEVLDTRGGLLTALGYGTYGLWPFMVILSEIIQTFILADFCYYYVQSLMGGQLVLRLPSGVV